MFGGGDGWADLPVDLFSLIFSKLSLPQLLRSAAVCVSWSVAVHEVRTRSGRFKFQGQGPWLMFAGGPDGDPSAAAFYALDERRGYTIPLPDPPISRRQLIGSAHGWVITYDTCSGLFQLLNPITGSQIGLPSANSVNFFNSFIPCNLIHDNDIERFIIRAPRDLSVSVTKSLRGYLPLKATLSADPSLGDDYTVALVHHHLSGISFAFSGHESWFWFNGSNEIQDILFHKGKLYATTITGSVLVCVIDDAQLRRGELPRFTSVVPSSDHLFQFHYLAVTPRGDLLNIRRKKDRHHVATVYVEVYKLRLEEEEEEEEEQVKDLGDFTIFLGSNLPLCLSASDFPHLTPNSIYFTDNLRFRHILPVEEQSQSCPVPVDVIVYNMNDHTFRDHTFRHILPGDLRLNWLSPVWFKLE